MSYLTVVHMANSQSLLNRVAACAAELGNTQPRQWVSTNLMSLVAQATQAMQDAWDAAETPSNYNPDIGARDDVITDAMILQAVTTLKTAQGSGNQGWP